VADLIQVLLRPIPERRPSAEQLLTCSKLENEVKAYLAYINSLKEQGNRESRGSRSSADAGYGSGSMEAKT
jgi:hypothetical protein